MRGIPEVPRAITVRAFMYRAFLGKKLELEPLSDSRLQRQSPFSRVGEGGGRQVFGAVLILK